MFKLIVESSKDITEIKISYADGSSSIQVNNEGSEQPNRGFPLFGNENNNDNRFNAKRNAQKISKEVIKPPVIERREKPTKIAEEMQNLDI